MGLRSESAALSSTSIHASSYVDSKHPWTKHDSFRLPKVHRNEIANIVAFKDCKRVESAQEGVVPQFLVCLA